MLFIIFRLVCLYLFFFFFSSRRRHTRCGRDWSSDVCSSDLSGAGVKALAAASSSFKAIGTDAQPARNRISTTIDAQLFAVFMTFSISNLVEQQRLQSHILRMY